MDQKKNKVVIKSNHLVEASYKLTVQEVRVILLLSSMLEKDDDNFRLYKIRVQDFVKFIGVKDKDAYKRIKDITRRLKRRELIIKEPKTNRELQVNWLASADYLGNGYVELELSQKLKPYLIGLKEFFTRYELETVIRLKSIYSIRIYELLKQYEKIGEREFEIDHFRNILGIDSKKYTRYYNFKKKVILVASDELANKTDISFTITEKRERKTVKKIKFYIVKKEVAFSTASKKKYVFSEEMEKLCSEIKKKSVGDRNDFSPKVFVLKALKQRKHPAAIILVLNRLNDYWETSKADPWAYGTSVLNTESQNYHEQDTIRAHEKLKKEPLPDWLKEVL